MLAALKERLSSRNNPDQNVANDLSQEHKSKTAVIKILCLGSGGSGKSTLFKQFRTIHGSGWTKQDRLTFVDHIHAQIIEQMKLVLECIESEAVEALRERNGDDYDYYKALDECDSFKDMSSEAQQAVVALRSVKAPKV